MTVNKSTNYGKINVSEDAVSILVGGVVSECYGVVGMASRNIFKDGFFELLKKENFSKGINVKNSDDGLVIDIYIVVGFGVRISEIVYEIQKKVKYVIEKTLQVNVSSCNVYVQGIKVIE